LCFNRVRETFSLQALKHFFQSGQQENLGKQNVICTFCGHELTRVIDKREGDSGKTTRRRRECQKCARRFTTFERVETLDLLVVKKDGKREPFDRIKLRSGVIKACEKRPVSAQDIENIIDSIEADLRKTAPSEIPSKKIGELVTKRLKKIDKVAYIRFASVYREFADISDFEKELANLSKKFKK